MAVEGLNHPIGAPPASLRSTVQLLTHRPLTNPPSHAARALLSAFRSWQRQWHAASYDAEPSPVARTWPPKLESFAQTASFAPAPSHHQPLPRQTPPDEAPPSALAYPKRQPQIRAAAPPRRRPETRMAPGAAPPRRRPETRMAPGAAPPRRRAKTPIAPGAAPPRRRAKTPIAPGAAPSR